MPNLTSHRGKDYEVEYDNYDCDVVFLSVNNYNGTHLVSGFAKVFKVILASPVF